MTRWWWPHRTAPEVTRARKVPVECHLDQGLKALSGPAGDAPALDFPPGDLWVFGYGSLMWNPGFPHLEMRAARVRGYHRALCVWSWVYRGTEQKPGLVLGLDSRGSCVGRAFRVRAADKWVVIRYLYEREMVSAVYRPMLRNVWLRGGKRVTALTFRADRTSPQYAAPVTPEHAASVVAEASGRHGANLEYVTNTVIHLATLGIEDTSLREIQRLAQERTC